jgi:hypothetical protein
MPADETIAAKLKDVDGDDAVTARPYPTSPLR